MVRVTFRLQLLLLVLILRQSDAVSDQCRELQEDRARLQQDIKDIRDLNHKKKERAGRCMVSGYYIAHVSSL